jgi:hypothetical protein
VQLVDLVRPFPFLWHLTLGGWDGIRQEGFLRAVDLGGAATAPRVEITDVVGPNGVQARLRDQRRRSVSTREATGPADEWWSSINGRVFFFTKEEDALRMREDYATEVQHVIKLRTAKLLENLLEHVEVSTVQAAMFPRAGGPSRGADTFVPLSQFPVAKARKITEVTVTVPVPCLDDALHMVVRHAPDEEKPRRIWPPVTVPSS